MPELENAENPEIPENADDAEGPAEFENRAARRAKGKAKTGSSGQPQATGQRLGGRGAVQSPRQYGTRRSG
jgi:hypothetical protein